MFSLDSLDVQYSPSKWSKRFDNSDFCIEHHIKVVTAETKRNLEIFKHKLDMPYGSSDQELFDVYFKEEELGSPIFVYIHGGYWQELSKNTSAYCVELNYRVVIVDYSLCPNVTLEEIVNQIFLAIRRILEYGIQTGAKKLWLCGHSAGAHLLAETILDKRFSTLIGVNLICSIFLISGVYDLTELWNIDAVNPNNVLTLNVDSARKLSPFYSDVSPHSLEFLKILIMVAEHDSPKFIRQSKDFYNKLAGEKLRIKFKLFKNLDHYDIVENLRLNDSEVTRFVLENL